MALACTATPTATPTLAGPMYSEKEAIAVVKEHLQASAFYEAKVLAGGGSKQWPAKCIPTLPRKV